jgi:hypothetical protein
LAPRDVPAPPELQPNSHLYVPQGEDSFEIVVMVRQEKTCKKLNSYHRTTTTTMFMGWKETTRKKKKRATRLKVKMMKTTPLSNTKKEETFHDTDEIKTTRNEAPIPTGRLRDLLNNHNITTQPEFRIKRVLWPRREEYKAIVEIFSGPNVLSSHKGLAFRATYQDAVATTTWQAITSYDHRYHEELKSTVCHLLPQRKKNKFKTFGVKADVPRMLMVHHLDVAVEMSTRLQAAQ